MRSLIFGQRYDCVLKKRNVQLTWLEIRYWVSHNYGLTERLLLKHITYLYWIKNIIRISFPINR